MNKKILIVGEKRTFTCESLEELTKNRDFIITNTKTIIKPIDIKIPLGVEDFEISSFIHKSKYHK